MVLCGDPDRQGRFRVLHPNDALSELALRWANCCVKRLRSEQSRTEKYAPVHPAGAFLALHPNIALSELAAFTSGAPPRPRRGKEFAEGGLAEGVTSQSAERFIAPRVFSVSIGQNADFGVLERGFYCLAGSRQVRAEPRVTVEV